MAKAPKKKQPEPKKPSDRDLRLAAFEESQRASLAAFQERQKERLRPKNYQDLLAYAQQFNELDADKASEAQFPTPLSISAQEAFSSYYGSDYERQQAAAAEYARQLAESEKKQPVQIDPKYYEELQRQVPVANMGLIPHYDIKRDKLFFPSPVDLASFKMSLTQQELSENNYGSQQDLAKSFLSKLGDSYRDTIEHEAGHISDKYVKFSPKPRRTIYSRRASDLGYMGKEDHLVTGLGKVQREFYAKTGARIESPDQFKRFVLDLAKAENTEEAISGFSEEAKRSLRPQIQNAKEVQKYYNEVDDWEKTHRWLRGSPPRVPETQLDFLEKSALLIPGLVQTGTRNKSSV